MDTSSTIPAFTTLVTDAADWGDICKVLHLPALWQAIPIYLVSHGAVVDTRPVTLHVLAAGPQTGYDYIDNDSLLRQVWQHGPDIFTVCAQVNTVYKPAGRQPVAIRLCNRIGRGLSALGMDKPVINAENLLARAKKRTGLSDYGSRPFVDGLQVLVDSLNTEAQLSQVGRIATWANITRELEKRLQLIEYRKKNPTVCEQEILRPVIITGLPRSGTTLLYELLSQDREFRAPLAWEVSKPLPVQQQSLKTENKRVKQVEWEFRQLALLAPGFKVIHPMGATSPQECALILASAFHSEMWRLQYFCPGYRLWYLQQDPSDSYLWHYQFLQHLQTLSPTPRWLLKNPMHLGQLDTLLSRYPGASIIQTHRNPLEVVGSASSMACVAHSVHSQQIDPAAVGAEELAYLAEIAKRGARQRLLMSGQSSRILDIQYETLVSHPMDTARAIYRHFGWPLSRQTAERMQSYLVKHPRHRYGEHRYALEQFGLSADSVEHSFADYLSHSAWQFPG